MKLGIEEFVEQYSPSQFQSKKIALLAHPASVDRRLQHSIDVLLSKGFSISCAFGPQHGMKGDKQDNMIESEDYTDPIYKIPVYSLYGETRKLTKEMCDQFDVLLVDLQDVGCRIYTYLTTLGYILEGCAEHQKEVFVLDRPNPVGRAVEGSYLKPGWESFVGVGPLLMRHGFTLGEFAKWYVAYKKLDLFCEVISMTGYEPDKSPHYGWPEKELSWVNPSPNLPRLSSARCFSGTVLLEGTHLSEGRGTTRALEMFGASSLDHYKILKSLEDNFSQCLNGCYLRVCYFEPTFHKFVKELCSGLQIHTDVDIYDPYEFKPYRLIAAYLKTIKKLYPEFEIWRKFPYEYENEKMAVDLLSGGEFLKNWVNDSESSYSDLDDFLAKDEKLWEEERRPFLIY